MSIKIPYLCEEPSLPPPGFDGDLAQLQAEVGAGAEAPVAEVPDGPWELDVARTVVEEVAVHVVYAFQDEDGLAVHREERWESAPKADLAGLLLVADRVRQLRVTFMTRLELLRVADAPAYTLEEIEALDAQEKLDARLRLAVTVGIETLEAVVVIGHQDEDGCFFPERPRHKEPLRGLREKTWRDLQRKVEGHFRTAVEEIRTAKKRHQADSKQAENGKGKPKLPALLRDA